MFTPAWKQNKSYENLKTCSLTSWKIKKAESNQLTDSLDTACRSSGFQGPEYDKLQDRLYLTLISHFFSGMKSLWYVNVVNEIQYKHAMEAGIRLIALYRCKIVKNVSGTSVCSEEKSFFPFVLITEI
jgi:hypothetical protein